MMWLWTAGVVGVDNWMGVVDRSDPGVDGVWTRRSEWLRGGVPPRLPGRLKGRRASASLEHPSGYGFGIGAVAIQGSRLAGTIAGWLGWRAMAVLEIVQFGDPRLRAVGEPVVRFDRALGPLIDDMIETMRAAPGVGLAAQQIGRALQLCVMEVGGQLFEVVNPRIVHLSGEQEALEGCLSLEGYYAPRRRAAHAVMVGRDRRGQSVRVSGDNQLARAIQHEFDHLQGILYVDGLEPGAEIRHVDELHEVEPD